MPTGSSRSARYGTQFTDRFRKKDRQPSGQHAFDRTCTELEITHCLNPPRTPQMNGMVERFNGRISEVLRTHHFESSASLEALLEKYVWMYNHHLPQRALGHVSPINMNRARLHPLAKGALGSWSPLLPAWLRIT